MNADERIEEFIVDLDTSSRDKCVNPDNQNLDCCDCYLCRVTYFNNVRSDLKNKIMEMDVSERR